MTNMDTTIPEWKQKIHQNIQHFETTIRNNPDKYPTLLRATTPINEPSGKIIGRDMHDFKQALKNPEKANVILLGDAGAGKTAFIQGFAYHEDSTSYLVLSTNIERLINEDDLDKDSGLSNGLSDLFAEVKRYSIEENMILIMFIDEFHRIAMLSPSAVESMKPTLEYSARNGYRIVAATTFEEYDQWISGNRALDQRFLRISLPELGREAVIEILKNRVEDYGLSNQADENIYGEIYHQSKHILISNSQPRASIDMLMSMIGNAVKSEKMVNGKLQRIYATPEELDIPGDKILSRPLLHRYIRRAYGIDIDNKIHVSHVRKTLETKIYNQDQAVRLVMQLLERMLVGFSDPSRPKISFLSTGPTGVGKALDDDTLIPVIRHGEYKIIRHGDIQIRDKVFNRKGEPVEVTGVYPQGMKQVYEVQLTDGRIVRSADEHLWSVAMTQYEKNHHRLAVEQVINTADMLETGISLFDKTPRFYLPVNHPIIYTKQFYDEAPYNVGVTLDIVGETHCIPKDYFTGSIEQRWELIRGLFDIGGVIKDDGVDYPITYYTQNSTLASDIQKLLWTLGVSTIITTTHHDIAIKINVPHHDKIKFFNLPSKLAIAKKASTLERSDFDNYIGIRQIRLLDEFVPMTCIMVDDEEHLYQLANGVVTHNTELAKQASEALGIPLKRFDMSRYSRPEDAIRFADELAAAAWSAPNAYILIDEAEKSTKEAMNILLQVLDDARLTAANNPNRVISFTGNIINLTTNLGSETYQHMKRFGENDRDVDIEVIYRSLADSDEFETAVLGRLDAIVPFVGLPDSAMNKIAMSELERQIPVVETARRQFFISPDVVPFVVLDKTSSDTERGGARDIKRNINDLVLGRIASYLATNPDEVPVIILLEGRPRFKNADVGDPDSARISLVECHPHILVDSWVTAVGNKLDTIFHNDGLFIPKSWDINQFAKQVIYLARNGVRRLTTEVDGETVTIEDSTGRYKRP